MKKKIKIILLVIGTILVTGLGAGYLIYDKTTDYVIANVFETLLREDLAAVGMLGVDGELIEEAKMQMAQNPSHGNELQGVDAQLPPTDQGTEQAKTPTETQVQNKTESEQEQSITMTDSKPLASNKKTTQKTEQSIEARVKEIVKSIPVRDKNAVMRLIMQNVSSNDIRYLSGLVTDGNVSGSDIAKAKEIAYKSFTPEQMKQVKYYYTKYIGLFSEFY